MARREEGVTERLIESARVEFLEKGYDGASLRSIADRAGSSKGAIYIRYADKADLYAAVVKPAADGLIECLASTFGEFGRIPADEQEIRMHSFADDGIAKMIDYIYDHFKDFEILVCSGEESLYSSLMDRLVELDTETTYRYIEAVGNDAVETGRLTPEIMHMINTACFTGIFEIVRHGMDREAAKHYVYRLCRFYRAGWSTIFHPDRDEEGGRLRVSASDTPASPEAKESSSSARGAVVKCAVDLQGWVRCPVCGCKTRTKVRTDTVLENFPLFCPKCHHETVVNWESAQDVRKPRSAIKRASA